MTALLVALLAVCAASAAMAAALFAIKVVHRGRLAELARRRRMMISALGEVIADNEVPPHLPQEWATDPVFLEVLFEYVSIVTGAEARTLDRIIAQLDLRDRLANVVEHGRRTRHRLRALMYLVEIAGPEQRALFREALSDPVAEIRLHAARGLAVISDAAGVPLLLDLLQRETPWNTGRLADILVDFGSAATPALLRYLTDHVDHPPSDPDAMREVIRTVGLIGSLEAEPVLLQLLASEEALLRIGAASALADCGTPASVPALIGALSDADWRVRARAADALSMFPDARAVEPLAARLRDAAWWVRQNAAKALAEIPGGVARLAEALHDDDQFSRDAARYQLGSKKVIRAARQRIESGIGSAVDRRILAASRETFESLLTASPGEAPWSRRLVGDGVVDRFDAYGVESTLGLVERLRRIRRSLSNGDTRFPSFKDAGGSGPFLAGGRGGGGFRPVGGRFTTRGHLEREEARVRAALQRQLESTGEETET